MRRRAIEELTLPEQDKPNITIIQTTAGKLQLKYVISTDQRKSMSQTANETHLNNAPSRICF